MNALDVSIVLALVAAVVGGWRRGLVARVCTGVGAVGGLLLAASNLPWTVAHLPMGDRRPGFFSVLTALAIGGFAGRLIGTLVGRWVRRRLPGRPVRQLDRTGGAVIGAGSVAMVVWLAAPLFALVPGWPATQWAGSRTSRVIDGRLPPSPDALGSLRFLLADASFPRVLDSLAGVGRAVQSTTAPSVPAAPALSDSVLQQAVASTVSVRSRACGRTTTGTGTIVGSRLLVTNAHVVAGASTVEIDDGLVVRAGRVVSADAAHDLALVEVAQRLSGPPLHVVAGSDPRGAAVGIGRGSGTVRPIAVALDRVMSAEGRDIYDHRPVVRDVLVLAGRLQPGDSGGPVVDADGRLVGVMFARAVDRPTTGFAIGADAIRTLIDAPATPSGAARCLG